MGGPSAADDEVSPRWHINLEFLIKNPEKFQETVTYIASLSGLMIESPTIIRFKSEYVKTQKHFLVKETETLNHWIERIDSGLQLLKKNSDSD